MTENDFFDERTEQSRIKTEIVTNYFNSWSSVILSKTRSDKIAYIDLFCGPGTYTEGTESTPINIIKTALSKPQLSDALVTLFNDKDEAFIERLKKNIHSIEGISALKYKPIVMNSEVDNDIISQLESLRNIPSLLFVDPWGYKGLSSQLIQSVIKNWGCECIFFFNYNRIHPAITNPKVLRLINELFNEKVANNLRRELSFLIDKEEKEACILNHIVHSLYNIGGKYTLRFRFVNETGKRTSHYLVFTTKNVLGYDIMKGIMAKRGEIDTNGISSFEFNPLSRRQSNLFDSGKFDELIRSLLKDFTGRTLTMEDIFEEHNVGTPYIKKNYKDALKELEKRNQIIADPPAEKRQNDTFPEHVKVTFIKQLR